MYRLIFTTFEYRWSMPRDCIYPSTQFLHGLYIYSIYKYLTKFAAQDPQLPHRLFREQVTRTTQPQRTLLMFQHLPPQASARPAQRSRVMTFGHSTRKIPASVPRPRSPALLSILTAQKCWTRVREVPLILSRLKRRRLYQLLFF